MCLSELSQEKCVEKMRLILLSSCKLDQPSFSSRQVPLKQIGDTLQLTSDQVETLAVRAIGLGLIDGKIDQKHKVVQVGYVSFNLVYAAIYMFAEHR